jgi:hypothetical protein
MQLRQPTCDRQAEAGAHALLLLPRLDLYEGLEQALQVLGADAHPLVAHSD